jgi:hypothetical protein
MTQTEMDGSNLIQRGQRDIVSSSLNATQTVHEQMLAHIVLVDQHEPSRNCVSHIHDLNRAQLFHSVGDKSQKGWKDRLLHECKFAEREDRAANPTVRSLSALTKLQ